MAVDPAVIPNPPAPAVPPAVVPNTVIDPVRKYTGIALLASGLFLLVIAVIITMFPAIGGVADAGFKYGPFLFMAGVGVIWDRTTPVIAVP